MVTTTPGKPVPGSQGRGQGHTRQIVHFFINSAKLYFVTDNANSGQVPGLRARKREATRSAITASARLFTARNGLNGFTIEALCDDVGISRRTFFNYFPSKEDAIIGHLLDEFPAVDMAAFMAGGSGAGVERGPHGLSTTLLRDLCRLTGAMVNELGFTRGHISELIAAIKKEPQLMMKVVGSAQAREQEFSALIAQREGRPSDDPLTGMAAALFSMCSHRASQVYFSEENTVPYDDLLAANLLSAQELFTFSTLTLEGTP